MNVDDVRKEYKIMSYIYAYKQKNTISILSDTKPTISSNDILRLQKRFNDEEYNNFIRYGFIKTVIYKSNITISSAGDVEHFNEFLKILYNNNIEDVKEILSKAVDINFKYNGDTDFIITTENEIYEIKEKGVKNVTYSWIGDDKANEEFEKFKENHVSKESDRDENEKFAVYDAFKYLINNPEVDTVGGFTVKCTYEDNRYKFLGTAVWEFVKPQILEPGQGIIFYSPKEDGGFSFVSRECSKYYCGYFGQIDKDLVYKSGYSDENYKYISMPHIVDRQEFLSNCSHCEYFSF